MVAIRKDFTQPGADRDLCPVTQIFTRPDIASLKDVLNLTTEQIASCFGVSPSLASGWINGTRKPIGPARKLLLLVERHPELAEQIKSL